MTRRMPGLVRVNGHPMRQRLDKVVVEKGLATTRSQAENYIRLGKVTVDGDIVTKAGYPVDANARIKVTLDERYVSRAGLKLASVADVLRLDFKDKVVLDVGSSTGGFTDYALQHGVKKVFAVDVGTDQLHPSLRGDARIELHEKTDIRDFNPSSVPDIVVIDVSFISMRQIIPALARMGGKGTRVVAMVKPQFEASYNQLTRGGIVKNDTIRRAIFKDFEVWMTGYGLVVAKADSEVAGAKGNRERFYLLSLK